MKGLKFNACRKKWMLAHDPLSSAAPGWSGYRFGWNRPNSVMDPSGLAEVDATGKPYPSDGYSDLSGSGALAVEFWGAQNLDGTDRSDNKKKPADVFEQQKDGSWKRVGGSDESGTNTDVYKFTNGDVGYYRKVEKDLVIVSANAGSSSGPKDDSHASSAGVNFAAVATATKAYNLKNAAYSKIAYNTFDLGSKSPVLATAGSAVKNVSLAATGIDYMTYLNKGGNVISPESMLFVGDMMLNRMGVSSPHGFILNAAWEAGKAGGRYKNYLERKYSPGGLDGLISTPNK